MDINKIISSLKAQIEQGKENIYKAKEIAKPTPKIQKYSLESNKRTLMVLPKQLQFEFNPLDPTDSTFNKTNPLIVNGLVSEFIVELKKRFNQEPNGAELKEAFLNQTDLDITPEQWDTTNEEVEWTTKEGKAGIDRKIFKKFLMPLVIVRHTQKLAPLPTEKYGTEKTTLLEFDELGNIKEESKGKLLYQALMFERALANEKIAKLEYESKGEGIKAELANKKKAERDSMGVKAPRLSGVVLFYELPLGKIKVDDEEFNTIYLGKDNSKIDMSNQLRYMSCDFNLLESLTNQMGTREDLYADYLFCVMTFGSDKEILDIYKSRTISKFNTKDEENEKIDFDKSIQGKLFEDVLPKLVKTGLESEYEATALKNVYKFKAFEDSEILVYFAERLKYIKNQITPGLFRDYGRFISQCSPEVNLELINMEKNNGLATSYLTAKSDIIDVKALDDTSTLEELENEKLEDIKVDNTLETLDETIETEEFQPLV